jgi:hypothetical protein
MARIHRSIQRPHQSYDTSAFQLPFDWIKVPASQTRTANVKTAYTKKQKKNLGEA